ncbi:DNA-binding protein [Methanolobus mangrovi]|uniref:DNA-binding protein n=1 Tax=Methanolobus mangrovi TaxID=3072977 RepID=A0AA51UDN0_9EURY|nr:DNA-binding protein [Methanolobus mangrovi]WMW21284.1 DNA-binding protein [Methanolobus mangrovi]
MVEREVAHRMFAQEFNDSRFNLYSNSSLPGNQEVYSPNFLISPTGLKVNRVFVVGVITEVDRLSDQNGSEKELWRARISDPTGAFTVYAGSYQPEASVFLSTVSVPSYVMVLGKVRSYEPGDGSVYVSLRPEEINYVDESVRDRWIVDTAEMTLERLDAFDRFFSSSIGTEKLMDRIKSCNIPQTLASGMCLSLDYYHKDKEYYDSLKCVLKKALCSIGASLDNPEDEPDYESIVQSILETLDDGGGFDYSKYIGEAVSQKIPQSIADSTLKSLLSKGHIYEPKAGLFKVIH